MIFFLSPRRVSLFLAWGDFHAPSRFARSTAPEEKCGTTRSLKKMHAVTSFYNIYVLGLLSTLLCNLMSRNLSSLRYKCQFLINI